LSSFRELAGRSPTSCSHQNRLGYYTKNYTKVRVLVGLT
jgi:hypothetical protein